MVKLKQRKIFVLSQIISLSEKLLRIGKLLGAIEASIEMVLSSVLFLAKWGRIW